MGELLVHLLLSLPLVGAFAMFALGIVVIYRASGVLNLAHGAMAMVPAYVTYSLSRAGVPIAFAFIAGIVTGAIIGFGVERFVLRRLRGQSATTQTVGTVAVFGLLVSVAARVWGTAPLQAPDIFPAGKFAVGRSVLHYGEIGLFAVALIATAGFFILFQRTDLGLLMRGAAENPRAAALMGVDPDMTTSIAWMIGGALAGASGVLLASVTNLQPYTLALQVLPAFVAVLIGGLGSLPGALAGAVVVGLAEGIVPSLGALGRQAGSPQLVLTVVALGGMALRGARTRGGDARGGGGVTGSARGGVRARARTPGRAVRFGVPVFLLAFPWLPLPDSIRGDANLASVYVVIAVSLVILTGWVGQISLAHATFIGVAAFTTGLVVRHLGIPFPLNLPIAAAVAAASAVALGVVALRVRGLYLAVATLIFGWMADAFLFKQSWFVGAGGSSTIPSRPLGVAGGFPYFDFTSRRTFYYVALAAAAMALFLAANVRDSKTGRAFFAVRGSEVAAASLGIDVTRAKLLAFGLSGMLAGVAGNLYMLDQRTARADQFGLEASLFYLAMAVVGGLTRLSGAVIAGVTFAALYEVFFRVRALDGLLPLFSAVLLIAALLAHRGGLAEGLEALWVRVWARARPGDLGAVRMLDETDAGVAPPPRLLSENQHMHHTSGACTTSALEVDEVTVRFGGLVAVDRFSLTVGEGEIVGLIGPNGAGKTTAFNAVSGLVLPTEGRVRLFGRDVTTEAVHVRARLGLGRTFQVIQLFGEMSVFDNLMTAAHLHIRSGFLAHISVSRNALAQERAARARVRDVLARTGLADVAERPAGDLPFGVLRRVEVARAVVTGARAIMLDEPASGLDDRETDQLGTLLTDLRAADGLSLLVIEHDVRFVTALADRLYVLDRGALLATGTAEEIRINPAVIAAYLGGEAPEPIAYERSL